MVVNESTLAVITSLGHLMRKTALLISGFAVLMGILALPAHADNLVGDKVVLRALDKVTATTEDYTVIVGETLKYGSLEIVVRHCEKRPPEETPETYAFLQITDMRLDGNGTEVEQEKRFSGWMFASSPALSALDHAVYDIWVLDCLTSPPPPELDPEDGLTVLENRPSQ